MQERHPLDVLSLVFGLLFAALAIPVLVTDTPWDFDAGWVVPAVIVAIGLVIGASAIRRRTDEENPPALVDAEFEAAKAELPDEPSI